MTQKVKAGRDRNLGYDYSNPPLADCQNVPGISVGCGELGEGLGAVIFSVVAGKGCERGWF